MTNFFIGHHQLSERFFEKIKKEMSRDILLIPVVRERKILPDDAIRYFVYDIEKRDKTAVLAWSSKQYPDAMAEDCRYAGKAVEMLLPRVRSVVLTPLSEGFWENRSYVIWPYVNALGRRRLNLSLNRILYQSRVISWCREAGKATSHTPSGKQIDSHFLDPLTYISENGDFPDHIRTLALDFQRKLRDGSWKPKLLFQHGDLWPGNVLGPNRESRRDFGITIIDWRGSTSEGYPFNDLLYYLKHGFTSKISVYIRKQIHSYSKSLGIDSCEISGYALSSLGHYGLNLKNFPYDSYRSLCVQMFSFLKYHHLFPRD